MRRKIAFILTLIMLVCRIEALADTGNPANEYLEETAEALTEAENQTEAADSTEPKDSTSSEKEELSSKVETEPQQETQETNESTDETDKADGETLTGEPLPVLGEEPPEKDGGFLSEEILKEEKSNPADSLADEEFLSEDDTIYNVSFPADTHAYMDPDNLSGKGQIFSDRYEIENFGNTDVAIKIKSIEIHYRTENGRYEFSDTEITDELPQIKKIAVDMVWEKESGANTKVLHVTEGFPDEYVIELKAAQHGSGSTGFFYFTGTMNANPDINWEDDDLNVTFYYEILNLSDMDEEALTDEDNVKNESDKNSAMPDAKLSDREVFIEATESGTETAKETEEDSASESKETEKNRTEETEDKPEESETKETEATETEEDSASELKETEENRTEETEDKPKESETKETEAKKTEEDSTSKSKETEENHAEEEPKETLGDST